MANKNKNKKNLPSLPEDNGVTTYDAEQAEQAVKEQAEAEQESATNKEQQVNSDEFYEVPKLTVSKAKIGGFFTLMTLSALTLSLFAVYKLYEPNLFPATEVEQAKPTYVTTQDFDKYTRATQQVIDSMDTRIRLLQQQLDTSRFGKLSRDPANLNFGNLSSKLFNTNTFGNYSTVGTTAASNPNEASNNSNPETTEAATTAEQTPANETLNLEVQNTLTKLLKTPEFQSYVTGLVEQAVGQHVVLTPEQLAQVTQNVVATFEPKLGEEISKLGSSVDEKISTAIDKSLQTALASSIAQSVAELTSQAKTKLEAEVEGNLSSAVNKEVTAQLDNAELTASKLEEKMTRYLQLQEVNNQNFLTDLQFNTKAVILEQVLVQTQILIQGNASLDEVRRNLNVAYNLAPDALAKAIEQDFDALSKNHSVSIVELTAELSNLMLKVGKLPTLSRADLDKANQQTEADSSLGKAASKVLSSFVEVKKTNAASAAVDTLYFKENLKLSLQTALLAAQTSNQVVFQNSLALAQEALALYQAKDQAITDFKGSLTHLATAQVGYDNRYQLVSLKELINTFLKNSQSNNSESVKPAEENTPAAEEPKTSVEPSVPAEPTTPVEETPAPVAKPTE